MTEQKPYQELQDVVRQKELVEAENEDIKRRLSSVLSIIGPICGEAAVGGAYRLGYQASQDSLT